MNNIISFKMMGGIGNILFSLATCISLSQKYNLNLKLYYDNERYPHTNPILYKNNIFKNFESLQLFNNFHIHEDYSDKYKEIIPIENYNLFLNGYFQSENYFKNYEDYIQNILSPDINTENYLKSFFKKNKKQNISLHIRRGDYIQLSDLYLIIDKNYYDKSISIFEDCNILIFSNDIEYCKSNFIGDNFQFIENLSDIEDLYLMSLCDHNIISNSTFSWWGAWLNKNKNKKVICPSNWFGKLNNWNTKDLIPNRWIKIENN